MGGRPSKGTSKDMRLSKNNPNAGATSKGKTTPPVLPTPTKPAPKKAGGKS